MAVKALIFDFDGTIADSSKGIMASMKYALEKNGVASSVTDESIKNCIGPPLVPMIQRILNSEAKEELINKLAISYREHYTEKGLFMAELYEDVEKVLEILSTKYVLFVVSSKPKEFLEKLMSKLGVRKYFKGVYGPDLGLAPLKKAELVKDCMAENKIATDECIMIGDKAEDIMAAKVNGIKTAGVLYGFGTVAELTQAGCRCLVEKPGNLIKLKYDRL